MDYLRHLRERAAAARPRDDSPAQAQAQAQAQPSPPLSTAPQLRTLDAVAASVATEVDVLRRPARRRRVEKEPDVPALVDERPKRRSGWLAALSFATSLNDSPPPRPSLPAQEDRAASPEPSKFFGFLSRTSSSLSQLFSPPTTPQPRPAAADDDPDTLTSRALDAELDEATDAVAAEVPPSGPERRAASTAPPPRHEVPDVATRRTTTLAGPRPQQGDDAETAWLEMTAAHIFDLLPDSVREEAFDDSATPRSVPPVLLDELPEGDRLAVRIGVDLYRSVFASFDRMKRLHNAAGMRAAAQVVENLLKLRLRRVHASLLSTFLGETTAALAYLYPAIADRRHVSRRRPLPIEVPVPIAQLTERLQRIDDILSCVVAPCDDESFAAVEDLQRRLFEELAEALLTTKFFSRLVSAVRAEAPDGKASGALWRALFEATDLLISHHPNMVVVGHVFRAERVVGLLCQGLAAGQEGPLGGTPARGSGRRRSQTSLVLCRRSSAMLLNRALQGGNLLRQLITYQISAFDGAWTFLLPALFCGDPCVEAEVQEAVGSILESNRLEMRGVLLRPAPPSGPHKGTPSPLDIMATAVATAPNPGAMLAVAKAVLDATDASDAYTTAMRRLLTAVYLRIRAFAGSHASARAHHAVAAIELLRFVTEVCAVDSRLLSEPPLYDDAHTTDRLAALITPEARAVAAKSPRGIIHAVSTAAVKSLSPLQ